MTSSGSDEPAVVVDFRDGDLYQRQGEVLRYAADEFYRQGYPGASMRLISQRLGITKGSLYHYVESKEDLLFQIIENQHIRYGAVLNAVSQIDDGETKFIEFARRHCLVQCLDIKGSQIYAEQSRYLGRQRRELVVAFRDAYEATYREIVEGGIRDGWIRPELEARDITRALLAMLNGIYTWYRPEGKWPPEQAGDYYADLVRRSVHVER